MNKEKIKKKKINDCEEEGNEIANCGPIHKTGIEQLFRSLPVFETSHWSETGLLWNILLSSIQFQFNSKMQ